MDEAPKAFSIDLGALRTRPKDGSARSVEKADSAGEKHGFVDREPKKRGGRKPSPRTVQVHAWVLPEIAEAIAAEATRTGKTQGVLIEEAWVKFSATNSQ
jgi:hypothetical protein